MKNHNDYITQIGDEPNPYIVLCIAIDNDIDLDADDAAIAAARTFKNLAPDSQSAHHAQSMIDRMQAEKFKDEEPSKRVTNLTKIIASKESLVSLSRICC